MNINDLPRSVLGNSLAGGAGAGTYAISTALLRQRQTEAETDSEGPEAGFNLKSEADRCSAPLLNLETRVFSPVRVKTN